MGNGRPTQSSILDRVTPTFRVKGEDTTYKEALGEAIQEIILDLRDRNKELRERGSEQREMLALAKSQIEMAQSENRRLGERLDRTERKMSALAEKFAALGAQEQLKLEEQRHSDEAHKGD